MIAAEHIQWQIAVAVVVTVKESPFLPAVQRVVGGVKVQDQNPGRLLRRAEEGTYKVLLQLVHLSDDLFVPRPIAQQATGCFQTVERALSRQGLAAISLAPSVLAFQILLATKKSQKRIGSKQIMIVEIFVSKTQSVGALRDKFIDAVLDEPGVTQIREALREPLDEPLAFLDFA
jgi:hypothetical protein